MAAKVTKSKSAERSVEGFSPFALLLAFLVGFLIWPFYGFMSYEVKYHDNGDISLTARKEIKTSEKPQTPALAPVKQTVSEPVPQDIMARDRWLVKKAVMEYNQRYPKMMELNLFELIGKGFLKELPNCPNNEVFVLSYSGDTVMIQCQNSKR